MISFRHHLLTLVAVFLALAVGIVLGGGLLSDTEEETTPVAAAPAPAPDGTQAYAESFTAALAPSLVAEKLADRQVAVVTIPGADETAVSALVEQVDAAGGSVSARYDLTPAMVDPGGKSLVDTLGSQLLTQQPADAISREAPTYERMGQLLGLGIATPDEAGSDVNAKARSVTESIAGAELMEPVGDVERRAPLVLLVLGDDTDDAILAGLATGLQARSAGVVVAGTTADGSDGSDGSDGQLSRLRADPASAQVSTVDGIDTAPGRVATTLALARALTGDGGAFGASGADGPVPLG